MGFLSKLAPRESRASMAGALPPGDPNLAMLWGMSTLSPAGVVVSPETYRTCPEADACVSLIEDTVATLPLKVYEQIDKDTRVERPNHPLKQLLDKPNDWQTAAEFRLMMEGFRQGYGNAYARIRSNGMRIAALEPIHPLQVWPFWAEGGTVAYRYTPTNGTPEVLLPSEMLHLRDKPFQRDLIRGQSKVERHREVIGRALATGEYLSRFFMNGAVPKTFLTTPQQLNDDVREQMRTQFEHKHTGLPNAHRIGILQGGIDVKTIGIDNEKAQVVEIYQMTIAQLARVWGIPLHLIGDMSKSTGSGAGGTGIEQQSIGFLTYHMRPKFVIWEEALAAALMSEAASRRYSFSFDVDGLLRGDFKSRMEGYAVLMQWGITTVNEVRAREDLPPVEGGDERMHPLNMAPASKIMDLLTKNKGGGANDNAPNADQVTRQFADFVVELRRFNEAAARDLLRAA